MLNKVLNRVQKSTVFPDKDNTNTSVADRFNYYFVSIGENPSSKISQPQGTSSKHYLTGNYSFFLKQTHCDEVCNIIMHMKNSNSAGADEISGRILKGIVSEIAEPFTYCINLSLLSGVVSKLAKIARVTPIFESGDKNDLCNYRPICILSTLSKVLEKVVYSRLNNYLDKLNIIAPSKYGFRKNSTTCMAILDLIEKINDAMYFSGLI